MSSDLFVFDPSLSSDIFSPFIDPPIDPDVFPDIYNYSNGSPIHPNPADESNSFDGISFLSSSPPSHLLENLSLCQTTQLTNASDSANGITDFSALGVKTEECQVPFDSVYGYISSFVPQNYGGEPENAVKIMQRSFISNSFDGKPRILFQPRFDSVMEESPNFQTQVLSSPETRISSCPMRRVCSTGDLQMKTGQTSHGLSSSPLATENSFLEESNFRVGRYSAEERKERIHRYRAKRTQRNFNKTIKYACRKTLADNRPRIRGRFARNDEAGEIPKAAIFNRYEEEDDLWIDGLHEEDEEGTVTFFSSYDPTQFQYHGYR